MCSHLDCFTFKTPIFFPSFFAIFGGDRLETSQERSFSTCFLFFFFFYFRRVAKMKEESELLVVLFCRGEYSMHKGGYKREKDIFFFVNFKRRFEHQRILGLSWGFREVGVRVWGERKQEEGNETKKMS